jgi:hypothetical protein
MTTARPTREQALDDFVESWATGILRRDSLPAREAAKISRGVLSGDFTEDEMTARIEARRAEARAKAAQSVREEE